MERGVLCSLFLAVNLVQPRITWEESLCRGVIKTRLSKMSAGIISIANFRGKSQPTVCGTFPWSLNCVRVRKLAERKQPACSEVACIFSFLIVNAM